MPISHDTTNQESKTVTFPPFAKVLFRRDVRYISLRGGRGAAKSVSIAKALLIQAAQEPLRILCGREIMASLKDSVYAQLQDEIQTLGLSSFYSSTQNEIRGANGSVFLFAGFGDKSADSIKSFANVDAVWAEESQSISEKTWQALIPTIRKPGSRFFLSWNPRLESDATWIRFVENMPPDCLDVVVNYYDNPWFPKELEAVRLHDEGTLPPQVYRNIWLGEVMSSLEGSVYEHEIASLFNEKRARPLTIDSNLSLHAVFDLGIADDTSILMVQVSGEEVRIVDFIEGNRLKISDYSDQLKAKGFEKATIWLPHDARAKSLQTGLSMEEKFRELGWSKVEITPSISVEDGIMKVREMMPKTYIDTGNCAALIEHIRRYRRNRIGTLVHDEHSHASDALRYVAINLPAMRRPAMSDDVFNKPLKYRGNLALS
ncbi:PBSX family phage terminase large subunit [Caballeronia sp. AZ1_KS37]|uniref:PBSX family phage terminase large subunit n=1 Tax=Caballeronia sp. AZ1_KS37 TaxID=2921756 RepID=UPI0020294C98|nr:PBSX family phage terminase large subunit [Caballeronia sp. AZ1_KS37]